MSCEKHIYKKKCKVPGQGECLWCDVCTNCGARPIDATAEVKG